MSKLGFNAHNRKKKQTDVLHLVANAIFATAAYTLPYGTDITIEWMQFMKTADLAISKFLSVGPSNTNNFSVLSGYGSSALFIFDHPQAARIQTTTPLNRWVRVSVVSGHTGLRQIYFDGVLMASRNNGVAPTGDLVGFYLSASGAQRGLYADMRIWNTIQTQKQISDYAYRRLTPQETLMAYYRLESNMYDYSGNAAHLNQIQGPQGFSYEKNSGLILN